jgi:putative hydrolase of the HAD superfamily
MSAVLFDLDGTLHDRATSLRRFASDHAGRLGLDAQGQAHFVRRFVELDANGRVWKDLVYSQLRQEFDSVNWPSTEILVGGYLHGFAGFAKETLGSTLLLSQLKSLGVKVAILTNGRSDLQRSVIAALEFRDLVDAVVVSEEVGFRKPQREIFLLALDQVATRPEDAIMVGDDLAADIYGAQGAGITPIAFRCAAGPSVALAEDMSSLGNEILSCLRRAA